MRRAGAPRGAGLRAAAGAGRAGGAAPSGAAAGRRSGQKEPGRRPGALLVSGPVRAAGGFSCLKSVLVGVAGSRRLFSFSLEISGVLLQGAAAPSGPARHGAGVQGFLPSLRCWFYGRKNISAPKMLALVS